MITKNIRPTMPQTIQIDNVVFQSLFSILNTPPFAGFLQGTVPVGSEALPRFPPFNVVNNVYQLQITAYNSKGCCPNQNSFERFIETFFVHKSWRSGSSAMSTV
jgi:hypothetical protein